MRWNENSLYVFVSIQLTDYTLMFMMIKLYHIMHSLIPICCKSLCIQFDWGISVNKRWLTHVLATLLLGQIIFCYFAVCCSKGAYGEYSQCTGHPVCAPYTMVCLSIIMYMGISTQQTDKSCTVSYSSTQNPHRITAWSNIPTTTQLHMSDERNIIIHSYVPRCYHRRWYNEN